jgi:hypothetical protein
MMSRTLNRKVNEGLQLLLEDLSDTSVINQEGLQAENLAQCSSEILFLSDSLSKNYGYTKPSYFCQAIRFWIPCLLTCIPMIY